MASIKQYACTYADSECLWPLRNWSILEDNCSDAFWAGIHWQCDGLVDIIQFQSWRDDEQLLKVIETPLLCVDIESSP